MRAGRTSVLVLSALLACTSRDQPQREVQSAIGSACAWIAGRWTMNGCGETECTFYEDNCLVHYDCTGPMAGPIGTGSIAGNTFTFGGGECTATIAGRTISGSCPACTFVATHR